MIENKVLYNEQTLTTLFSSKRFLLEATIEESLGDMEFASLLDEIRTRRNLSRRQVNLLNILRTHKPSQIETFIGLKKYGAFWWAANVVVTPIIKTSTPEQCITLLGWSNNHGTTACVANVGDKEAANGAFNERVQNKIDQGYTVEYQLAKIFIGTGLATIPVVVGLPDHRAVLEPFLGAAVPVPKREAEPAPTPVKKKKHKEPAEKPVEAPTEVVALTQEAAPGEGEDLTAETPKELSKSKKRQLEEKRLLKEQMLQRKKVTEW